MRKVISAPERIMRLPEVVLRSGLSARSVYYLLHRGMFPRPLQMGTRSVGWKESDVARWIATRPETRPRANVRKAAQVAAP